MQFFERQKICENLVICGKVTKKATQNRAAFYFLFEIQKLLLLVVIVIYHPVDTEFIDKHTKQSTPERFI